MILTAVLTYCYLVAGIVLAVFDAEPGWRRRIAVTVLWIALLPAEAIWRALAARMAWVPTARKLFARKRRIVAVTAQLLAADVPAVHGKSYDDPPALVIHNASYEELL
ncbi:hypothetical protein JL100_018140 [Skermanella mucosa]|uniref:hypothetical protein n=1 Tax=Skermanella mucosa TaxID=1789672 RepID=UPI00192AFD77|nr:hypothetical protein [Skermanella mucosa]UEM19007.1 hypothetical protein JL100_018140 [Skermanella mucosa]